MAKALLVHASSAHTHWHGTVKHEILLLALGLVAGLPKGRQTSLLYDDDGKTRERHGCPTLTGTSEFQTPYSTYLAPTDLVFMPGESTSTSLCRD